MCFTFTLHVNKATKKTFHFWTGWNRWPQCLNVHKSCLKIHLSCIWFSRMVTELILFEGFMCFCFLEKCLYWNCVVDNNIIKKLRLCILSFNFYLTSRYAYEKFELQEPNIYGNQFSKTFSWCIKGLFCTLPSQYMKDVQVWKHPKLPICFSLDIKVTKNISFMWTRMYQILWKWKFITIESWKTSVIFSPRCCGQKFHRGVTGTAMIQNLLKKNSTFDSLWRHFKNQSFITLNVVPRLITCLSTCVEFV